MPTILRVSLVAFLMLLQLLAPLVHAHAGQPVFAAMTVGKLHIPGLEALSTAGDSLPAKPTGHYQAATVDAPAEGVVVGVDSGIKHTQQDMLTDADSAYYLHSPLWVFTAFFSAHEVNFSPHTTAFVPRPITTAHTSRAPPSPLIFA